MIEQATIFGDVRRIATKGYKGKKKRKSTIANGYAMPPGTGPEGETCGSCEHRTSILYAKVYYKCDLCKANWTGGTGTDIRVRSPACSKWESEK